MVKVPFSERAVLQANDEWGCNCGPLALAFALQISLDDVRPLIPKFELKRFTNPTMMRAALETVGRRYHSVRPSDRELMFDEQDFQGRMSLVRIQWTGPWTASDAQPRWAYRYTHWITTWTERRVPLLFDTGIWGIDGWEGEVVPVLTTQHDRADGGWLPTHIWRLARCHSA